MRGSAALPGTRTSPLRSALVVLSGAGGALLVAALLSLPVQQPVSTPSNAVLGGPEHVLPRDAGRLGPVGGAITGPSHTVVPADVETVRPSQPVEQFAAPAGARPAPSVGPPLPTAVHPAPGATSTTVPASAPLRTTTATTTDSTEPAADRVVSTSQTSPGEIAGSTPGS